MSRTGAGLPIVKRIIHPNGGRVWVEGKAKEAVIFPFALPKRHGKMLSSTPLQEDDGFCYAYELIKTLKNSPV